MNVRILAENMALSGASSPHFFVRPWHAAHWAFETGLWEGHSFMLHITCDLCGKEILPGEDHRFVVKMEVFAAHDPAEITEADLDEDHMEAVSKLLEEMEDNLTDTDDLAPS